jgi:transposase-like protein
LVSVWHIDLGPLRIEELRERHRAGATVEELAREVGCSASTMKLALG